MNALYERLGITRQGMHARHKAVWTKHQQRQLLIERARGQRKDHPGMGCRRLYGQIDQNGLPGRDACERMLLSAGFGVAKPRRSFTKAGEDVVGNLAEGMRLYRPGQLWQTDITYVWSGGRWRYASFMLDVYTRQILAHKLSDRLEASYQVELLNEAVRAHKPSAGLIVHTDRGVQYTSAEWKQALERHKAIPSMARCAWENAYCERVHRTIKEEYLKWWPHGQPDELVRSLKLAVHRYNTSRRHSGLPGRQSPDQFARAWYQGQYPKFKFCVWSKLTSTATLNLN
jgi:transposase InsO family protein